MKRLTKFALSVFVVALILDLSFLFADINADMDIIPAVSAAEIVESGSCGENVTYTLDSEGIFTILGAGNMNNYHPSDRPWNSSRARIKKVIIADGVTSIGECTFSECGLLQSVTIPDSVTSIGDCAFYYCSNLQSVTIPDSVTSIGNYAFFNCSGLYSVTIGDYVTSIGESAFRGCSSLQSVTIPDSVTSIGDYAFCGCSSLLSVTIPDSVTSIGNYAFYECSNLQSVTIPDSVTSIGNYAFFNCSGLYSVTIPDSVTSIGNYAFSGCGNLQIVTIPDSVTSIEDYAFYYCSSLRCVIFGGTSEQWSNITIGSCNYPLTDAKRFCLGDGYVADGKNILNQSKTLLIYHYSPEKIYTVPSGIKSIEQKAFYDNENLSAVILPEGLKNIGSYAFSYSILSSIYIPVSVSTIDQYAFNNCSRLSDVYFGGTEEQFKSITIGNYNTYLKNATIHYNTKLIELDGAVYTEDMKTLVEVSNQKEGAFTVPATVTTINTYAFSDCGKITEILIPETVTVIGNSAFRNCDGISEITLPVGITKLNNYVLYDCDNLQSITIPDNVTSIGEYAFYGCENLKTVRFNSGLLYIGNYAFYGCKELEKLSLPETLTTIGNYSFSGCTKLSEIYFPASLTEIGSYAFSENSALAYVSLPNSVNSLGTYVFYKCTNLEKIGLPEGTLASIPANAFYGCENLKTVRFNSGLLSIGNYAFYGCKELEKLSLPETLTTIGNYSFSGCTKLSEIYFPASLTEIGSYAFSENSALVYVSLPNSVNSLGTYVFYKCTNLEKIGLPEGTLASIPANAFNGCQKLTDIFIPENITSFGDSAFLGCNNLSDIYYNGTETEWDKISIVSSNSVIWAANIHFEHTHTYNNWQAIIEPGSDQIWLQSSICDICGYEARKELETKHTGYAVESISPTCFDIGYSAGVYCTECEEYISGHEEIEALGHDEANHDAKAPTCTEIGWDAYVTCSRCDYSTYAEKAIDADSHKWNNGAITTTATCKVSGVKTYTCQHNASHKKTENLGVNASNHVDTKGTEAVAPTCSAVGYTAGVYCNDCENYISGHTEIGIDANAHNWDNGTVTTTATCKVSGVKTYTCQHNSAHKKTESLGVNASNHVNTKNVAELKATCTTKGYTAGVYCNDCQKYISGHTEIPVDTNAHKWDNGTVTTIATCKVSGVKTCTCQYNSAHKKTESLGVNASNHVNTKNVAEVKATCTKVGYTSGVYCNDCQKYISGHKEIAINPSNHVNTKTVPETPATFDKVGYTEGVFCNDCQQYILGHKEIPVLMNIGDVDGNGKIDASDARLALRAAVGLENFNDAQKKSADADGDGQITAADARLILRAAVGLEELKKRNK